MIDGRPVGFLMLEIDLDDDDGQFFWLWRLMLDADEQRKGYGAAAVSLALDELRSRGATETFTSWVPGSARAGAVLPEARIPADGRNGR